MQGLYLTQDDDRKLTVSLNTISEDEFEAQTGDTVIKVNYSSFNYKDALALTGKAPVVRSWPMVPGIDGVGEILETTSGRYKKGDHVILNGWGCGETHWGCFATKSKLHADWLIPLPSTMTEWQAMAIGTAGYTAALCVMRLVKEGVRPEQGSVLVTGATGGVGSFAILYLKKLGYYVTAMSSKADQHHFLTKLGADQILSSEGYQVMGKPLQKPMWSGAVDSVGSTVLANICAQMEYDGVVACCGLAKGMDLNMTVAPFILKGVTLAGIDSVMLSYEKRVAAWEWIAHLLTDEDYLKIANTITLNDCVSYAEKMIAGKTVGRAVVDVNQ